jgi:hypothetical protein
MGCDMRCDSWRTRIDKPTSLLYASAGRDATYQGLLLSNCPSSNVARSVNFDVDHIRTAANGAIFDILLRLAGGKIDGDHDLFAATVAEIVCLGLHEVRGVRSEE